MVQIASKDPQFSTLVTAIKEAGLVGTLKGDGPFTVFAPTNDAFAELPDGALDELLKDKDKLRAVLTYHVVPGNIMSTDIKGKTTDVETVEGSTIAVDATNGVMINDAMVIKADIKAKNGVIHVIDAVLMPGQ
ncbi:MAG TPA: Nex18 symbiotically induced protein [Idiomarina baltica]|uniref:Nex18 symbiotically induced protein n=2 Tax=Idiomarina TaxID=135575 RepID=A0A348WQE6_9GAMM|nr:Nex18 symbiotically induced protein [Idiomarina baltica]